MGVNNRSERSLLLGSCGRSAGEFLFGILFYLDARVAQEFIDYNEVGSLGSGIIIYILFGNKMYICFQVVFVLITSKRWSHLCFGDSARESGSRGEIGYKQW